LPNSLPQQSLPTEKTWEESQDTDFKMIVNKTWWALWRITWLGPELPPVILRRIFWKTIYKCIDMRIQCSIPLGTEGKRNQRATRSQDHENRLHVVKWPLEQIGRAQEWQRVWQSVLRQGALSIGLFPAHRQSAFEESLLFTSWVEKQRK
jgi:hypothetical protein